MVTVVVRRKSTNAVLESQSLPQAEARAAAARIRARNMPNWEVEIVDVAREHRGKPFMGVHQPKPIV
jgi:hypothetical protein